jgi:RimJ/RimL family protein N-acetyltransferase
VSGPHAIWGLHRRLAVRVLLDFALTTAAITQCARGACVAAQLRGFLLSRPCDREGATQPQVECDNVAMSLVIREMAVDEVDLVIGYFHDSTPEHLEILGVDPTRLPTRQDWRAWYVAEYRKPIQERSTLLVIWELEGAVVGFSTADKIVYGEQAHMHLHIVDPQRRGSGVGAACVRETAGLYFNALALSRLYCEPNAFNVAPNRTLQSAGFRYVKTYNTVPGPLNYHQAVTRWVLEAGQSRE